jgi:hypothetical protein
MNEHTSQVEFARFFLFFFSSPSHLLPHPFYPHHLTTMSNELPPDFHLTDYTVLKG